MKFLAFIVFITIIIASSESTAQTKTYTGTDDSLLTIEKPQQDVPCLLKISGNSLSSNFSVKGYDEDNASTGLLVNTIDEYDGIVGVDLGSEKNTVLLEINAEGSWTIEVWEIGSAEKITTSKSGDGDNVLWAEGNPAIAEIIGNSTSSHFSIITYNKFGKYEKLLVNTTGPYDGDVLLPKATQFLEINAEGSWTINLFLPRTLAVPTDTSTIVFLATDSTRATLHFTAGITAGHSVTFESLGQTPPSSVQSVPPFDKPIFYFDIASSIPDSISFQAQLTFAYTTSQLSAAGITDESALAVAWFNPTNSTWNLVSATINTATNTITFTTNHFSIWALAAVGPTGIVDMDITGVRPTVFSLSANRPNPFNPATTIAYDVPQQAHITLTVYNLLGQEVARLVNTVQQAGRYTITWDARNAQGQAVSSGVYLYRLSSSTGFVESRRMLLLK